MIKALRYNKNLRHLALKNNSSIGKKRSIALLKFIDAHETNCLKVEFSNTNYIDISLLNTLRAVNNMDCHLAPFHRIFEIVFSLSENKESPKEVADIIIFYGLIHLMHNQKVLKKANENEVDIILRELYRFQQKLQQKRRESI